MNVIEAEKLSLRIGGVSVLRNMSFSVPEGGICGLVGYNGTGKTSLLRVISGLAPNYEGSLKLFGNRDFNQGRKQVGTYMEFLEPDSALTAETYLRRVCSMLQADPETAKKLLEQLGLEGEARKLTGRMSLGMRRRLMLACALVGKPKLLLLDEPFNGLDPQATEDFGLLLLQLCEQGITVVTTSHLLRELLWLADSFVVIRDGGIAWQGSRADASGVEAYKTVIQSDNPAWTISRLRNQIPNAYCMVSSYRRISVFSAENGESLSCILGPFCASSVEKKRLTMEEFLRWKMNG